MSLSKYVPAAKLANPVCVCMHVCVCVRLRARCTLHKLDVLLFLCEAFILILTSPNLYLVTTPSAYGVDSWSSAVVAWWDTEGLAGLSEPQRGNGPHQTVQGLTAESVRDRRAMTPAPTPSHFMWNTTQLRLPSRGPKTISLVPM